jgi:hypothetical protein
LERKDYGGFDYAESTEAIGKETGVGQVGYYCETILKDKKAAPTPGAERWIDVNVKQKPRSLRRVPVENLYAVRVSSRRPKKKKETFISKLSCETT